MIKVVHSVNNWLPKSMIWLHRLIEPLELFGVKPLVVAEKVNDIDSYKIKPIVLPSGGIRKIFAQILRGVGIKTHSKQLEDALKSIKPDILHSHFGRQGWLNHKIAKELNLPHVVSFYGYDVNKLPRKRIWRRRYTEMFENVDMVLCEGPFMASCIEKLGCPREKIALQRVGIELEDIKFQPRKIRDGEKLKILIAARFTEKKGIPLAIKSLGILSGYTDNFEVTVVGGNPNTANDGESRKILSLIREYRLQKYINFIEFMPLPELMKLSYDYHVFLSPSITAKDGDTEGGAPVMIIEMAATGMPIVSTTHCDIPFVLGAINRSMLVAENDYIAIANLLRDIRKIDLEPLAIENRKHIELYYDKKDVAAELAKKYELLLKNRGVHL